VLAGAVTVIRVAARSRSHRPVRATPPHLAAGDTATLDLLVAHKAR